MHRAAERCFWAHAKRVARWCAVIVCALAPIGPASAQRRDDVPLPPRLDREPAAATGQPAAEPAVVPEIVGAAVAAASRPPNAANLAPLPDERANAPDEIIVIGKGWRLPDLGSAWRAKQQEKEDTGRFSATFLPLYDPDNPPERIESPLLAPEARRVGYIDLFRLRFGRRAPR
jgi:hypothetical protein